MNPKENTYSRESIYTQYLQEVASIRFTIREIDIIACMLHNRGEKKTALLLSISPRTVGTHARNIMSKIGCNSRDGVIDFIERSGKLQYIRQYYFCLQVQSLFEGYLQTISKSINRDGIVCSIELVKTTGEQEKLLQQIRYYLKLSNIDLVEYDSNLPTVQVHLIAVAEMPLTTDYTSSNIILILNKENDVKPNGSNGFIDFSNEGEFYFSIIELLRRIIGKAELEDIFQRFHEDYKALQYISNGDNSMNKPLEQSSALSRPASRSIITTKGIVAIAITLATIIIIYSLVTRKLLQVIPNETSKFEQPEIISYLDEFFAQAKNNFSSNNLNPEQRSKNYDFVRKMEKVLARMDNPKVQSYFTSAEISSKQLMNYLYSLQALASYYNYIEHNGEKARKILLYAKNLAENYVISKNTIQIDFEKLDKEEIYEELSIIKDLPEIYTRIVYMLGRSFILQGNKDDAIKYFELSHYLGEKLGLFEGYLSVKSGLERIKNDKIEIYIKDKLYQKAREELIESISLLKELRNNNKRYILDYKPNSTDNEVVVPREDIHNQVDCGERLIKHYAKLLKVTQSNSEKQEYIEEIAKLFLGGNGSAGIFAQLKVITSKKVAVIYNLLGNVLLQLYDEALDSSRFREEVIKLLKLSPGNDLEIIRQIFDLARAQSRNTDFTKADAYDGLIKVYQRQIAKEDLKEEDITRLNDAIKELKRKRDEINIKLKRTTPNYN